MTPDRQAHDRARFVHLVEPLLDDLFRFALRLCGDRVGAEDLVQQTLLVGLNRLDQLQADGAIKTWLFRILYRTFLNHRKRKAPMPAPDRELENLIPLDRSGGTPHTQTSARELGDLLAHAFDQLPEHQREAVWLVDGLGSTYAEAARILGIPVGTTTSRVLRGRMALRAQLSSVAREQGVIQ